MINQARPLDEPISRFPTWAQAAPSPTKSGSKLAALQTLRAYGGALAARSVWSAPGWPALFERANPPGILRSPQGKCGFPAGMRGFPPGAGGHTSGISASAARVGAHRACARAHPAGIRPHTTRIPAHAAGAGAHWPGAWAGRAGMGAHLPCIRAHAEAFCPNAPGLGGNFCRGRAGKGASRNEAASAAPNGAKVRVARTPAPWRSPAPACLVEETFPDEQGGGRQPIRACAAGVACRWGRRRFK